SYRTLRSDEGPAIGGYLDKSTEALGRRSEPGRDTHWPSRAGRPSPPRCGGAASRAGPTPELAAACRRPRCWPCRREAYSLPPPSTSWGAPTSLAGFQVSTTGRFWVSTEVNETQQ